MGILNRERVTVYPWIFLAIYLFVGVYWVLLPSGLVDRRGRPKGTDFVGFYAAATLASRGRASDAYDPGKLYSVEREVIGADFDLYTWNYPPTFMLLMLPFSRLPYIAALFLWTGLTLCGYLLILRVFAPHPLTTRAFLAFPGVFQNALQGQNGFLTTTLFGGGLRLLDDKPIGGGLLLGLLSYKPQLAWLVLVALIAGRRWKAAASAAASAAVLAGLSLAALGSDPWRAFFHNVGFLANASAAGVYPLNKMPTVFGAARLLGVGAEAATAAQAVMIVAAVCAVAWVWSSKRSFSTRTSVLIICGFLAFPFLYDYDLVLLSLPLAILGLRGCRQGWLPGEEATVLVGWSLPVLATVVASAVRVQIAPLVLVALMIFVLRHEMLEGHRATRSQKVDTLTRSE